jgi:hypothetical protein
MAVNTGNITSANAVFLISVPQISVVSTQLQGFATDSAFDGSSLVVAEAIVGVDGHKSAGWLPHLYTQNIHLQADSNSISLFDLIVQLQDANLTTYLLQGNITLSGLGKSFALNNGTITEYAPIPSAKKMLDPQDFVIVWESVKPAII